jgi:hypothetical protein
MDFHGARIDSVILSADKNTEEGDKNWLAGPMVLYNEEDGLSVGLSLLRRF